MICPDCSGKGCTTCGNDGTIPDWLADRDVNGSAADTWK
jgi:hypothetical protein